MKKCIIYDGYDSDGFIYEDKVFEAAPTPLNTSYCPKPIVYAEGNPLYRIKDCCIARGGFRPSSLVEFEVDNKIGKAHSYTGKIIIPPIYEDIIGYLTIDSQGNARVYSIYQDPDYIVDTNLLIVQLEKDGLWGVINPYGKQVVDFEWEAISFEIFGFLAEKGGKYAVLSPNGDIIVDQLDRIPERFTGFPKEITKGYVVKRGRKFGALGIDGTMLTEINMLKKDAIELIIQL